MEGYLKKHATQSAYTTWAAGSSFVTPNVSLIDENEGIQYNPFAPIAQEAGGGNEHDNGGAVGE